MSHAKSIFKALFGPIEPVRKELQPLTMANQVKNAEILKGFGDSMSESGLHAHGLARNLLETYRDAKHVHVFPVITIEGDICMLVSEEDGEHGHAIDEVNSIKTDTAHSAHMHVVRVRKNVTTPEGIELKSGMALLTEVDGEHTHGADLINSTNFDGAHQHVLNLGQAKDGSVVTVKSLLIKDFMDLMPNLDFSDAPSIPSASCITRFASRQYYITESHHINKELRCHELIQKEKDPSSDFESIFLAATGQKMMVEAKGKELIIKEEEVQALILSKAMYKNKEEAQQKAIEMNYPNAEEPTIGKENYTIRVRKPSEFKAETLKKVVLEPGLRAMVGSLRDEVSKELINKATEVQTLIFPKEKFSLAEAKAFIKRNDAFSDNGVDETSSSYRFRQFDPSLFKRMRTMTLPESGGIKAVVGVRKEDVTKEEDVSNVDVEIIKEDDEQQIVMGVVLEPGQKGGDAEGDIMTAEEIEKAQNFFMTNGQSIGFRHKKKAVKTRVVQSFIAPSDMKVNGKKVKKGSWLLAVQILDGKIWKMVKEGMINGFSVGGFGERVPVK